ncbi:MULTISPECIES: FeoB-associated Cys-rich membrane protein [Bacillota]|nr:hypothetical protein A4V01_22235 [Erysipelotrichaceae bacterium I46]ASU17076.1 FeoB-associated Cys-rich membrane protein [[Clostridium] innocuum]MDB3325402.1 FeoB-associated Cys-rich membrane protein [Clostridioides difficile]QQR25624.1 FeoB-associated Cys-rich membrane protein [[Clostridium] innocuum]RHU02921.1 FeoB-associated Cys-rich membrane protein [Absiella sp. AM27-20]
MFELFIIISIILYSLWTIRKKIKDLKNGNCCSGCSSCPVGSKCATKMK